jgi:transposase
VAPLIPPARRGGRKRTVNIREVCKGLLDGLRTGWQWRALPKAFPPRSTIAYYCGRWEAEGTLGRIPAARYGRCGEHADRSASPTACLIDSPSVKSAEKGGRRLSRQALRQGNKSRAKSATW